MFLLAIAIANFFKVKFLFEGPVFVHLSDLDTATQGVNGELDQKSAQHDGQDTQLARMNRLNYSCKTPDKHIQEEIDHVLLFETEGYPVQWCHVPKVNLQV